MTGCLAMTIADGVSVAVHRRTRSEHPSVFVTDTVLSYSGDGTARLGADPSADSKSKRPIVIVAATAVALVLVSIGIAAAIGAFSDGELPGLESMSPPEPSN